MKKMSVALAAALVVAVAAPAAAGVKLDGSLENKVIWRQNNWTTGEAKGFSANSNLKLNVGFNAGGGDKVKAVLELAPWSADLTHPFGPGSIGSLTTSAVGISKAYIETNGAFWNGGAAVTTRLGALDVAHSEYVSTLSRDGLNVEGVKIGPATLGAFMAWDGADIDENGSIADNERWQARGLRAQAAISGVSLDTAVVKALDETDFSVAGKMSPMKGAEVSAVFGALRNTDENARMLRLEGSTKPMANVTLVAGYRRVDSNFEPIYVKRTFDDLGNRTDWVAAHRGDMGGFNVGIQTTQQGVNLSANYDDPRNTAKHPVATMAADTTYAGFKLNASNKLEKLEGKFTRTETVLGAEKTFKLSGMDVTGSYKATIPGAGDLKHEIGAKTTLNVIPQLQGLALDGSVTMQGEGRTYGMNAVYTAPNGITLGAHYDNVKKAWVDAGVKVTF